MKGKLVILATGCMVDNYGESDYATKENKKVKNLIENLENEDWHLHHSIFVENYQLFDNRSTQSKINTGFCRRVSQALEEGSNIFIVVPDADLVDKRLRAQAIIVSLPKVDKEE